MQKFLTLFYLANIVLLIACKKDESIVTQEVSEPETSFQKIEIDSTHNDVFTGASYRNNKIIVTGYTEYPEFGFNKAFLIIINRLGEVVINRSYDEISRFSSPIFTDDYHYACLAGDTTMKEVILFAPNGDITSRFSGQDKIYQHLEIDDNEGKGELKKILVNTDGFFFIMGLAHTKHGKQTFIVKTDIFGNLKSSYTYYFYEAYDFGFLSNGIIALIGKTQISQPLNALIGLDHNLKEAKFYMSCLEGQLYSRPDVEFFYTGNEKGFNSYTDNRLLKSEFWKPDIQIQVISASISNDGGLIICGHFLFYPNSLYFTKHNPLDRSMEWGFIYPVEAEIGTVQFIHQLPDGFHLGVTSKNNKTYGNDLIAIKLNETGEL